MNEEFLKSAFQLSPIGCAYSKAICNDAGMIIDCEFIEVNDSFGNFVGMNNSNIQGKNINDILSCVFDDNFDWIKLYQDIELCGEKKETNLFSKKTKQCYRVTVISPKKNYFVTYIENVSRELNTGLQTSMLNQQLKHLLDSLPMLIVVKDIDGKFLFSNKTHSYDIITSLELNIDDIVGKYDKDLIYDKNLLARWKTEDREIFKNGNEVCDDFFLPQKDGSSRWFRCIRIPYYQPEYDKPAILAIGIDIHERKLLETYLKEREQELIVLNEKAQVASIAKNQFLATMSHEIRTPINGISGFLQLLEMTDTDEDQKQYIDFIKESTKILLNVIDSILDISKIESGKIEIDNISFDLKSEIETVVAPFMVTCEQRGLDIHLSIDSKISQSVMGDPIRLKQIMNNLLSNALKFTHEGGISIDVKLENCESNNYEVSFTVADTGIGIKEKCIENLFQPFMQVDNSSTREYGGTGLGLAICKSIVEKMGGNIHVKSVEGEGTSFVFHIKFHLADALQENEPEISIFKGKRLLIIDENNNIKSILRLHLEEVGCIVDEAQNAVKAITKLADNKSMNYSSVLIDSDLSSMDINEFKAAIKAIKSTRDIPLIIINPSVIPQDLIKDKNQNFEGALTRPVKRNELLNCLSTVLKSEKKPAQIDSSIKILVVEDDKINEEYVSKLLKTKNIYHDIAINGQEAIEAYNNKEYDLILMDCQLPIINGYDATRKIREIERNNGKHTPIIALTAYAMIGDDEKCIEAGMDECLTKPVDPNLLVDVIDKYSKKS